jgi:hypothetical protein
MILTVEGPDEAAKAVGILDRGLEKGQRAVVVGPSFREAKEAVRAHAETQSAGRRLWVDVDRLTITTLYGGKVYAVPVEDGDVCSRQRADVIVLVNQGRIPNEVLYDVFRGHAAVVDSANTHKLFDRRAESDKQFPEPGRWDGPVTVTSTGDGVVLTSNKPVLLAGELKPWRPHQEVRLRTVMRVDGTDIEEEFSAGTVDEVLELWARKTGGRK